MGAEPTRMTAAELSSAYRSGELSPVEATRAALDAVARYDEQVNAFVRVDEEAALSDARESEERWRAGRPRGPVDGVPTSVKDIFLTRGRPTLRGTLLIDEEQDWPDDAPAVARLREAGAVLLGKTTTPEFAWKGVTDSIRHGATGNPWDPALTAGGSSGGSAAALAAHMTPAATGTDTAGSLRIPSAMCGTSTVKPTYGTTSFRGVVPLAPSFDHAGPMARNLEDCGLLLAAITGSDRKPGVASLDGARLAVSPRLPLVTLDPDVAEGFERAQEACRGLGAEIVGPPPPPVELDVGEDYLRILYAELAAWHRRFADRRDLYRPALREWVEQGEAQGDSAIDYAEAQIRRAESTAAWSDWLAENRIAAVIEPTVPVVAWKRGDGYDHAGSDVDLISLTHHWNWTGFPAVALPAGVGSRTGLPVGVSLIGAAGSDWHLLGLGIALQSELGVPEAPVPAPAHAEADGD
jgi:aspartyl-tRNA(Asn)/glutamyl-tRNA(Gln) amidotransferase subunit A